MNFSFMTVSFPVDGETYNEMKALCEEVHHADGVHYESILNLPTAQNSEVTGFSFSFTMMRMTGWLDWQAQSIC